MSKNEEFKKIPVEISMCIASITEALEFWFREQVFQVEVEVDSVNFSTKDNTFKIRFKRLVNETSKD